MISALYAKIERRKSQTIPNANPVLDDSPPRVHEYSYHVRGHGLGRGSYRRRVFQSGFRGRGPGSFSSPGRVFPLLRKGRTLYPRFPQPNRCRRRKWNIRKRSHHDRRNHTRQHQTMSRRKSDWGVAGPSNAVSHGCTPSPNRASYDHSYCLGSGAHPVPSNLHYGPDSGPNGPPTYLLQARMDKAQYPFASKMARVEE